MGKFGAVMAAAVLAGTSVKPSGYSIAFLTGETVSPTMTTRQALAPEKFDSIFTQKTGDNYTFKWNTPDVAALPSVSDLAQTRSNTATTFGGLDL